LSERFDVSARSACLSFFGGDGECVLIDTLLYEVTILSKLLQHHCLVAVLTTKNKQQPPSTMKISLLAIAVVAPVASAFVAPQAPAFSTQLQSSTMPQAWSPPAQQQQEAPPTATWTPPAAAQAPPVASYAPLATASAPLDEQRGQPLQVYEQIDRAAPGQWWKGAYSNDNIAAAGYEGYPSNRFAMQRSRMAQQTSSAIQRSTGSKPQPRQGRTWWMGVEGGIGYCQGGP
jgi:hypothetical protein